ncbi:MAG: diaminopimelate epimerase [Cyclobacteriaceae bacterium]
MQIPFYKYQATGNDFVLVDNRKLGKTFSIEEIKKICNRKFGVGADGLILVEEDPDSDFKMVYFNSDGTQSLCGNGCRSVVDLASQLHLIKNETRFKAYDGYHKASILENKQVRLQMNDVRKVEMHGEDFFVDPGNPHYVMFVPSVAAADVVLKGREIRNSEAFRPEGTNVNFVELLPNNEIAVRTYERGVEDETLSCGSGVTASVLAASYKGYKSPVKVHVQGGQLAVEFKSGHSDLPEGQAVLFSDVFLLGPAKMVFKGQLEL